LLHLKTKTKNFNKKSFEQKSFGDFNVAGSLLPVQATVHFAVAHVGNSAYLLTSHDAILTNRMQVFSLRYNNNN